MTVITVDDGATHAPVKGHFLDGQSAQLQAVDLTLQEGAGATLDILFDDGALRRWPLDDLRRIPDQADPAIFIVTSVAAPLERLIVRDAAVRRNLGYRAKNLAKKAPVKGKRRLLGWGAGALASVAVIIFGLVPFMANQLAMLIPPAGEKALGDATYERVRAVLSQNEFAALRECDGFRGLVHLRKMVAHLEDDSDLPLPVRVIVLDHPMVNAFALPGGRIVFFRGMIDEAESPEELAAVLAHEMGHVAARDPTRHALRSAGSIGVLGLIFGDFAGGSMTLVLANQLIDAQYSQGAEAAADDYAAALLLRKGIAPSSLADMFEKLRALGGDGAGLGAHFQSHPQLGDRIEAARAADARLPAPPQPLLTEVEFAALKSICN